MQTFPDDRSIALLKQEGVDYVIVHEEYYDPDKYGQVIAAISGGRTLREVHRANDGRTEARIYRLAR